MPGATRSVTTPLPDLIVYRSAACRLCDEADDAIRLVLTERSRAGLPTPDVIVRDIAVRQDWHDAQFDQIPVVEIGDRRLAVATSVSRLRRLLADALDGA